MSTSPSVLIVEARFYPEIADQMAAGAIAVLDAAGVKWVREAVPGCFELPAAIKFAVAAGGAAGGGAQAPQFAGFIALGCVIRGETDHYEHICREACRGLMDLSVQHEIALGFGVLTCHSYEQAWVRAAIEQKNKGADAATACVRMMALQRQLRGSA
jgi:6,7-dimethyl-8-ribityllumazine synthase